MSTPELEASWARTAAFLRDARAHLSEAAEVVCQDEIYDFEEHLDHNELELALDSLEQAVQKNGIESRRVIEFMLKAAENMRLTKHTRRYAEQLKDLS